MLPMICLDILFLFYPSIWFVLLLILLWWLFPCSWCFSVSIWSELNPVCHHSAVEMEAPGSSSSSPALEKLPFFRLLQSLHMPFYSSMQTRAHTFFHARVHAVLSTQEEFEDSKSVDWGVHFSMFANPDFPHFCFCGITLSVTRVCGKILLFRQMWVFNLSAETVWTLSKM